MGWEDTLLAPEERVLPTMERDGSRRWLYPRLAQGRFWQWRRVVGWGLIALFVALPFIKINGHPALLFDIVKRNFHVFGATFRPTETIILALMLLTIVIGIVLTTALLGRVWCGWGCPQSVYMELVFRPLERLFTGRGGKGGKPTNAAIYQKMGLLVTQVIICFLLANVFLAYFVGVDALMVWVTQSPMEHPTPFITMALVTGLMIFDFCYFREQTCIIACPYGRLQGALVDRDSLIIGYDPNRGEPRGRKKSQDPVARALTENLETKADDKKDDGKQGDCIDCGLCVAVCPTGIDIRDGLQFECIGCAQCIDACDTIMDRIGTPRGLVRYTSQAGLENAASNPKSKGKSRLLRPRTFIYAGIMTVTLTLLIVVTALRQSVDLNVSRNVGRPFVVQDGIVENIAKVKTTNRADASVNYQLEIIGADGVRLAEDQAAFELPPGESATHFLRVLAPATAFNNGMLDVDVKVSGGDGSTVTRQFKLLGPRLPAGGAQ